MDRLKSKMGRLKSKMGENVEQKRKAKLVEKSKFYQCLVKSQSRFFFFFLQCCRTLVTYMHCKRGYLHV